MELRRLFVIVRRRFILLVVLIVAGVAAAYLGSSRTSMFQADATVYVGAPSTSVNPSTEYGQALLAAILAPLIPTPLVVQGTLDTVHVPRQVASVVKSTTAAVTPGTNVIRVTVKDRDPVVAQTLANGLVNAFATQAKQLSPIVAASGVARGQSPVSVLQQAVVPTSPLATSLHRNVALGGLVGLLVGLALVLVLDLVGLAARTPRQMEAQMGIPVIGVVPLQRQIEQAVPAGPGSRPEDVPLLIGDDG